AETFIKDKTNWLTFNRLALKAARLNPRLIPWIWEQAGTRDLLKWLRSYIAFTFDSLVSWLLLGWLPDWLKGSQSWLEKLFPALWLRLLSLSYTLTEGIGRSIKVKLHYPIPNYEQEQTGINLSLKRSEKAQEGR
ncbi:MAG: flavin-dependent dehydrogenase, partial [Okeania sp. SIO2D1]|nr:flavin-dependent dehydrogenase [Okeania sp. SIO2D1]